MIEFIESGIDFKGFSAADKVVGKAAAFLYVLLGVEEVYADVMSEAAIYTLARHGIQPICDRSAKEIRNRINTGICPMEETVQTESLPNPAFEKIKAKLALLNR